jgi:tRNA nucleotidyltransferase/poly(A) polymerase
LERLLRTLSELAQAQGIEIWVVGGLVRDALLGRWAPDADLVLRGAVPFARQAARALGGTFVLLGDAWGTARVVVKQGPSRRLEVDFAELRGTTLAEDLACRDFTINAIACALPEFLKGPDRSMEDPFHGAADLQRGIIRAVAPGALQADPLRAVRAYRLAAQLGFTLDPATRDLARAAAPRLAEVAVERITAELLKLLAAPWGAAYVRELAEQRLLAAVLPEAPWEAVAAATAALAHLEEGLAEPEAFWGEAADRVLRWVGQEAHRPLLKWATLWDGLLDAPARQAVATRLKLSREQQRLWQTLAASRNVPRAVLRRALVESAPGPFRAIWCRYFRRTGAAGLGGVLIQWAHLRAGGAGPAAERLDAAAQAALRLFERELEPILNRPRLLTGRELQRELHLRPGPRFKGLLAALLQAELMGQVTTRQEALEFIRRRMGSDRPRIARGP